MRLRRSQSLLSPLTSHQSLHEYCTLNDFLSSGWHTRSYIVASEGESIVIDPERSVDGYVGYLAKNNFVPKRDLSDPSAC